MKCKKCKGLGIVAVYTNAETGEVTKEKHCLACGGLGEVETPIPYDEDENPYSNKLRRRNEKD